MVEVGRAGLEAGCGQSVEEGLWKVGPLLLLCLSKIPLVCPRGCVVSRVELHLALGCLLGDG